MQLTYQRLLVRNLLFQVRMQQLHEPMSATETLKHLELGERFLRRNPLIYPQARREFISLQESGLRARRRWQRARLRAVLRAAMQTPYGQCVGHPQRLEQWPLLDKDLVRNRLRGFTAHSPVLAARASTGGTTGVPLRLLRSPESVIFEQVCIDWLANQLGADPACVRIAVLRGDVIDGLMRISLGGRRLILSSNRLTPATVAEYADALEQFAPELLYAYPTSLENLCRFVREAGRRLHLPRVLTSSEVLHPRSWRFAEETLGCRLIDYYGQAERVAFAYALEPGRYRFIPSYAHVELKPSEQTAGQYEIIGTSLWNFTMPLVRYRTGDLIRLADEEGPEELESIALGMRSFEGIVGREQEILVGPGGVRLTGINQIPREVDHILRMQIVQESLNEVRVLVLPDRDYSPGDEARLLHNTQVRLPPSMNVRIETVESLERTAAGKTPLVIHCPVVREALRDAGW